jgi:hypothetical protein
MTAGAGLAITPRETTMRSKDEVSREAQQLATQLGAVRFERAAKERHEAQLIERLFQVDAELGQIVVAEQMVADAVAAKEKAAEPQPEVAVAPAGGAA